MSSATFLNVYNRSDLKKTAVLENARGITETKDLNQIYHLEFTLPADDQKAKYLLPFHFVRYGETGQLYRIVKLKTSESTISEIRVECEHVIATLCDTTMFGSVTYGGSGLTTADAINFLLGKQNTVLWELRIKGTDNKGNPIYDCDFTRYFEYNWEQENLLNALYSIPKEFVSAYRWDFDTSGNPFTGQKWKLYLREIDSAAIPEYYIRAKQNLLQQGVEQDSTQICTKLYPLGYGEGVNQLKIKGTMVDAAGNPSSAEDATAYRYNYLLAPKAVRDQYGIIEKVLVDRRFENQESLYAYGKTVLAELCTPAYARTFDVADLYPITGAEIDNAEIGKICRLTGDGSTAYITKTVRVLDDPGNLQIELSTKATDVVSQIADLADRVRIESVYSQGATQLYQHSKDANATPTKGMIMSLYFPSEMRQINKVLLRLKLGKFRSYSQATDSKTVTIKTNTTELDGEKTTFDGGGTTSSSGGTSVTVGGGYKKGQLTGETGVSVSISASGTVSAPMVAQTSEPSTNVTSGEIWDYSDFENLYTGTATAEQNEVYTESADGSDGEHSHQITSINIPSLSIDKEQVKHKHNINHYHKVTVSGGGSSNNDHSHSFSIPNHTHTITAHQHNLPNLSHKHEITFEGHSHSITAGIFESGDPQKFDIYIGGTKKATVNSKNYNNDITNWLLDDKNQIPRDSWIDVEIRPNDMAYVQASVFVQGFVQSRGGGNY